jgi:poly(A) polymerase
VHVTIPLPSGPGVKAVVAALGNARFVGGCVRDTLAGVAAKDIDLATPLDPQSVITKLEAAGIKTVPTGIAHGTITAVAQDQVVEVTTLRRDVSTDGRRATVAYTENWQEDAARRDFTINALYADPVTGQVFDYFGGVDDLAAGIVRFIGEPLQRIAEDHLRILRFFRFSARFAKGEWHAESLEACAVRANDLMALSRERIAMELLAILSLSDPAPAIAMMIEHDIFKPVLPEITGATALDALVRREGEARIAGDPVRRLSVLLPIGIAEDVSARLKLSKAQRKRLITAELREDSDAEDPKALAYWLGTESAIDRLLLGTGDAAAGDAPAGNAEALTHWTPPTFPLTGGAVVKRGIKAGPDVARILKAIERQWVAEGFPGEARIDALLDKNTQEN